MSDRVRVMIVDDQVHVCKSLKALLATSGLVEAVQEATSGVQALALVDGFRPDIVLMDIAMPSMNGLQATHLIKMLWPNVKIVLLSMYPDYRNKAIAAGADEFLCKADSPSTVLSVFTSLAARAQVQA